MGIGLLLAAFFGGCKKAEPVTSLDTLTLTVTGMRANVDEYEFVKTGKGVKYTHYSGDWEYNDKVKREDCVEAEIDGDEAFYQALLKVLTDCRLTAWDGFDKAAKYVLDGYMFSLKASVNGGKTVSAKGSNAYPSGYREFREVLSHLDANGTFPEGK